jgi:predicted RNA binding protein YcfA (HicA-like mRNA interferase family)
MTSALELASQFLEQYSLEEMAGAGWSAQKLHKHLKKSGWSLSRTDGGHDVFTHPKSKKNVAVPRHKGDVKAPVVLGIMKTMKEVNESADYAEHAKLFNRMVNDPEGNPAKKDVSGGHMMGASYQDQQKVKSKLYDVLAKSAKRKYGGDHMSGADASVNTWKEEVELDEGIVKDIKRLITGKDVKTRAGEEITKSQEAHMKGDYKTSKKHFRNFDRLDNLRKEEVELEENIELDERIRHSTVADSFTDGMLQLADKIGVGKVVKKMGPVADKIDAGIGHSLNKASDLYDKVKSKFKKEEVELEEGTFKYHMDKAISAHERGDTKKKEYHLGNAKTARYAIPSTDYAKHKDLFDKYKQMTEEVDLMEGLDRSHPIVKEYDALNKGHNLKSLRDIIKQKHRGPIDVTGFTSKDQAISHMLRNKHGDKAVAAAFGLSEGKDPFAGTPWSTKNTKKKMMDDYKKRTGLDKPETKEPKTVVKDGKRIYEDSELNETAPDSITNREVADRINRHGMGSTSERAQAILNKTRKATMNNIINRNKLPIPKVESVELEESGALARKLIPGLGKYQASKKANKLRMRASIAKDSAAEPYDPDNYYSQRGHELVTHWANIRTKAADKMDKISGKTSTYKDPFKEEVELDEARIPLEGHPYHNKSDAELRGIIKDAGETARIQKGMSSETKYLDQVNDASTVLYHRKKMKENVEQLDEISKKTISSALTKAGDQIDDPSIDSKKKVKRAKFINKAFSSLYANKTKFKEDVEQVDESLVGSALAAAAIGHAVHGDHTANAKHITRSNNPVMMAHAPNGGKLPNIQAPTAKPVKNKQGGYTQCAGSCTNEQVEVHFHGKEGYGVSQNGTLVKHHDDHAAAVAHAKSLSPVIHDLTEEFNYEV